MPTIRLTHFVAPVVAVDGPGGSGKGSLCRRLSAALGFHLMATGGTAKYLSDQGLSVESVKKVNIMVKKLLSAEEKEITQLGEEINILEHKCDELRHAINRILVSNNPDINPILPFMY